MSATVSGAISSYTYDGDGKRVSSTIGGTTMRSVYDVNCGRSVLLGDGSRKYVFGLGLADAVPSSGGVAVSHTDGLGSVRAITDAAGTVTQTYQTDEFGIPTASQGSSTQPFGYTGEQQDSTGLVYLRARMYDPQTGRFLQRDPFAGVVGNPLSLHRYTYVANNPINAIDPSGLDSQIKFSNDCMVKHEDGYLLNVVGCTDMQVLLEIGGVQIVQIGGRLFVRVIRPAQSSSDGSGNSGNRGNAAQSGSTRSVRSALQDLAAGAREVYVNSRQEAEEIFRRMYLGRGYRNTTGESPTSVKDLFGDKEGTYHWDTTAGHGPDNPHGRSSHLHIHQWDAEGGDVIRIFFPD